MNVAPRSASPSKASLQVRKPGSSRFQLAGRSTAMTTSIYQRFVAEVESGTIEQKPNRTKPSAIIVHFPDPNTKHPITRLTHPTSVEEQTCEVQSPRSTWPRERALPVPARRQWLLSSRAMSRILSVIVLLTFSSPWCVSGLMAVYCRISGCTAGVPGMILWACRLCRCEKSWRRRSARTSRISSWSCNS